MRALEFIRDHVTFKVPYDFSYHMKTPNITDNLCTRKLFKKNLQFVIKSGFKSRAGYNGARTLYKSLP